MKENLEKGIFQQMNKKSSVDQFEQISRQTCDGPKYSYLLSQQHNPTDYKQKLNFLNMNIDKKKLMAKKNCNQEEEEDNVSLPYSPIQQTQKSNLQDQSGSNIQVNNFIKSSHHSHSQSLKYNQLSQKNDQQQSLVECEKPQQQDQGLQKQKRKNKEVNVLASYLSSSELQNKINEYFKQYSGNQLFMANKVLQNEYKTQKPGQKKKQLTIDIHKVEKSYNPNNNNQASTLTSKGSAQKIFPKTSSHQQTIEKKLSTPKSNNQQSQLQSKTPITQYNIPFTTKNALVQQSIMKTFSPQNIKQSLVINQHLQNQYENSQQQEQLHRNTSQQLQQQQQIKKQITYLEPCTEKNQQKRPNSSKFSKSQPNSTQNSSAKHFEFNNIQYPHEQQQIKEESNQNHIKAVSNFQREQSAGGGIRLKNSISQIKSTRDTSKSQNVKEREDFAYIINKTKFLLSKYQQREQAWKKEKKFLMEEIHNLRSKISYYEQQQQQNFFNN